MNERLTKRYIIKNIENLELSIPLRYERYYINDYLRIQKKGNKCESETLNEKNIVIKKEEISLKGFNELKKTACKKMVRDSYLYEKDNRISIKVYLEEYKGLNRIEVNFPNEEELKNFKKEPWMEKEITNSPLAFDKYLSKLTRQEFEKELKKYLGE